jgi:hypothetical protein
LGSSSTTCPRISRSSSFGKQHLFQEGGGARLSAEAAKREGAQTQSISAL